MRFKVKYPYLLFTFFAVTIGTTRIFSQLPIKRARTISFTTDEGSYMDVDISPDGRTILFDLLGDLYTLPVNGGTATQLTRGLAINYFPIWAPDGQRIAYLSDFSGAFHLNVINLKDGDHLVLGKKDAQIDYFENHHLVWNPRSNNIAIDGLSYSLSGGKSGPQFAIKDPIQFSVDGNLLYFQDSGHLFCFDRTQNSRREICSSLPNRRQGVLSPDAHWWVYISDSGFKKRLIVQDLINQRSRILVPSLFLKYPLYDWRSSELHYSIAKDSKSLFIGYGGKIHRIELETGRDEVIPFKAQVKVDAGAFEYRTFPVNEGIEKVRYTRSANASRDGRHLVFSALGKLYVMNLDDGKSHLLVDQPLGQFQPIYSPDGKWICYVSWCDTAGGGLWRVRAEGGQPEKMTDVPGQYQRPTWSPDGSSIAVIKGDPILGDKEWTSMGKLEIVPVNGSRINLIDDSVPLWNNVTFSRAGTRIVYKPMEKAYEVKLHPVLVSNNLHGDDLQVLAVAKIEGLSNGIQQVAISPDERFIVFSMGEDLYLVPTCSFSPITILFEEHQKGTAIKIGAGVDPFWAKEGQVLNYTYGNKFYTINPDKIVAMAQKVEASGMANGDFVSVAVSHDRVVPINLSFSVLHAQGIIALRNVRIITMHGDRVIEHGVIVMRDGRFVAVGSRSEIHIPNEAKIFDLPGATVMPGLIDMHLHVPLQPDLLQQQSWVFLATLAYGVTTKRCGSLSTNFDSNLAIRSFLESGANVGPEILPCGACSNP